MVSQEVGFSRRILGLIEWEGIKVFGKEKNLDGVISVESGKTRGQGLCLQAAFLRSSADTEIQKGSIRLRRNQKAISKRK